MRALPLLLAASLVSGSALAQPKKAAKGPEKNPYVEALVRGERAFVAGDTVGATQAFQDAVKQDPGRVLPFYRLAEVHLSAGNLDDADRMLQAAQNKKGTAEQMSRVLFLVADLHERKGDLPKAKDSWNAYAEFLRGNENVKGWPGTASERIKVIERRLKDEKDYAEVKQRIAAREAERDKEARDNAIKDKQNR